MSNFYKSLLFAAFTLFFSHCTKELTTESSDEPSISVVNYPLAFFTQEIVGDSVDVYFPSIDGDPAFWQPSGQDIAKVQQSSLILLNGASYAKWVKNASLPRPKLLSTDSNYRDRLIEEHTSAHSHGEGDDHSHSKIAITTWLDPQLAKLQVTAIHEAVVLRWPEQQAAFDSNVKELNQSLSEFDATQEEVFERLKGTLFVGSHPVFQYLARRYQLQLESVHWEPDVLPTPEMWTELEELLQHHPAQVMLWEGEPLPEVVSSLEKMGIQSCVYRPCGNRPMRGDFFSVMGENLKNLQEVTMDQ
ncbi:metal ABC transporter substrate-binding protein [Rubritalea marina]|uniref:metal ABC transporter substrate-binding protein n=1 Tax=Rubritalea marina TaxID=361055 RepID=UPI0014613806|nr:zinc ABC transporter substrate-binding protein [Rubritalea marina]